MIDFDFILAVVVAILSFFVSYLAARISGLQNRLDRINDSHEKLFDINGQTSMRIQGKITKLEKLAHSHAGEEI